MTKDTPNPQLDAATEEELDDILSNLLGQFHEHRCISCNGTNGGCINCRKTGYDQTPCKICDKDGIAFKNRKEAKAALTRLLLLQRQEELKHAFIKNFPALVEEIDLEIYWDDYYNKRSRELQAQIDKGVRHDK